MSLDNCPALVLNADFRPLSYFPLPNQPFAPGSATGSFLFSGQQVTHENYYTTRVDHHFTNANTMVGTYVFDVADIEQPDEMNNKSTGFDTRRQIFTLEDTHIFGPRLVNAMRLIRSVSIRRQLSRV